jgi:hypothetical protein
VRKTNFPKLCLLTLLICLVASFALDRRLSAEPAAKGATEPAVKGTAGAVPGGAAKPNLSEGECQALGGTVDTKTQEAQACNSGKTCFTVDQNKQGHFVCISALQ